MTTLSITGNRGMHLTFENGFTLSVQIGRGHYCDNREHGDYESQPPACANAEIAFWNDAHQWFEIGDGGDTVRGYVSIDDVLSLASMLKALPKGMTPEHFKAFTAIQHFFKTEEISA